MNNETRNPYKLSLKTSLTKYLNEILLALKYSFLKEKKFNLSMDFCSHIENHTKEDIYGDVEKEVRNISKQIIKKLG